MPGNHIMTQGKSLCRLVGPDRPMESYTGSWMREQQANFAPRLRIILMGQIIFHYNW